jgi:hypothetical protein
MIVDVEEVKKSLSELLEATHKLANANPAKDSKSAYLRVLEGIFRKNYVRLQAVQALVGQNSTANVAVEITRNMVEDVVALEYIRIKGSEAYSKRFFEYWPVHYYKLTHRDLGEGFGVSATEIEEAEIRYEKLPKSVRERKNWAGLDVKGQLKFVLDSAGMHERDAHLAEIAYALGSLKTHFNPYDLKTYLDGEYFEVTSELSLKVSLIFAISSHVRFTSRYVEAINEYNGNTEYLPYLLKANAVLNQYN